MLIPDRNTLEFKPRKALLLVLIGVWIAFALLFGTLSYALQVDIYRPEDQKVMNYWYAIIGTLMILYALYVYNICSKKITVDDKSITYRSLFKTKSLVFSDIKGVRNIGLPSDVNSEHVVATPIFIAKKNSKYYKIKGVQNKELRNWAAERFIDLDTADYQEEVAEIRSNESLGTTVEERDKKHEQAKMIRDGIVLMGALLLLISILFNLPRFILLSYLILSSVIIFFGLIYYKGLMRMEWGTARVGVSIPIFVIGLAYAVFIKSTGLVNLPRPEALTRYTYMAITLVAITICYIFLLVGLANYKFKKIWMTLLLFGALLFITESSLNVFLDRSEPKSYTTTIREYKITSYRGISYTYTMRLELWNKEGGTFNEVGVSEDTYANLAPGTRVDIKEYQGAFGQKWFIAYYNGEELNDAESSFGKLKKQVQ